jgi:hypothetical protein
LKIVPAVDDCGPVGKNWNDPHQKIMWGVTKESWFVGLIYGVTKKTGSSFDKPSFTTDSSLLVLIVVHSSALLLPQTM